jgi:hypothetical protein
VSANFPGTGVSKLQAISPCRRRRRRGHTGRRRGMRRGTGRGQGWRVRHRRIPAHVGSCLAAGSAVWASPATILQATAAVADHAAVAAAARGRATDLAASTGRVGTDAVHAGPSRRAVAAFKRPSASVTNQSTVPLSGRRIAGRNRRARVAGTHAQEIHALPAWRRAVAAVESTAAPVPDAAAITIVVEGGATQSCADGRRPSADVL